MFSTSTEKKIYYARDIKCLMDLSVGILCCAKKITWYDFCITVVSHKFLNFFMFLSFCITVTDPSKSLQYYHCL